MKKEFFGYIPYTNDEFKDLWNNAVFVFDANILLSLYRYSNETKNDILNALENIKDRVWLPYNICEEFFRNRANVIAEQNQVYEKLKNKINFNDTIDHIKRLRHSSLDKHKDEMVKIIEKCQEDILNIIEKDKKSSNCRKNGDEILTKIVNIFDDKIGQALDEDKLKEYKNIIDIRYEKKIPPGYMDCKKEENLKYGDAINWLEILEYAKKHNTDIIFVSDDEKEDWMEIVNGKKNGPRKELLNEFYKNTKSKIYIYNSERFLQEYSINIESIVSDSIEEVRSVKEFNNDENTDLEIYNEFFKLYKNKEEINKSELSYEDRIEFLKKVDNFRKYMQEKKFESKRINEFWDIYNELQKSDEFKIKKNKHLFNKFIENAKRVKYNLDNYRDPLEGIYDNRLREFFSREDILSLIIRMDSLDKLYDLFKKAY